ncbi:ATP-binding cassette, subfamily B [Clostridium amylolyticum]|uniref:ATP-binding cassette, subfamily B n=1 Tax=Clostridium amylolyticum TaxID=1121298 RepID=A0A1M6EDZ6_9CLOT|nr:ABC transporter ATP-binding protein [Clostridium amylolyticum]SHI83694.1 ATP-binding cassette, subfamily B [Clostridium amylolyticum]
MDNFKWAWSYVRKYKYKFIPALILVLVTSLLSIIVPYLSGKLIDEVIYKGNRDMLFILLIAMIAATFIRSAIRYVFQMLFERVSQDSIFELREDLYKKLQELDVDFYKNTRTGDIMARLTGDVDAVRHTIAWVFYSIFENTAIFIVAMAFMMTINFKLTLFLIAITPVIGYLAYNMTKEVGPTFSNIRESFSKLNSMVQENISGNRVVKAFAKEDYEIEKFDKCNQGFKENNLISSKVWEKYLPVLDTLAGFLNVVLILVGGLMVINKTMTFGEIITFNSFIWALNNPMRMAGWLINDVQRFNASAAKIRELQKVEPKIKSLNESTEEKRVQGTVEFNDVSFSFEDGEVLKNIFFKAKPGQTVAILGPTGSGKSTLVNLICRFYDVTSGNVMIDGKDIRQWDVKKLRENIAVAMQDIFLFSDTIEGNIMYGAPNAPIDQVYSAAAIAGADEFIKSFPEGYETIVGERGVGLSGGQKQRIALARALLKNPSILILDDTTSAVDMETEYKIHKELNSLYNNKTTFIIAHRLSSVKDADEILVLDKGEIIERGTHKELINKKGYYYSVYLTQFGDFDHQGEKEVM